jgi:hypothetical protein
MFREGSASGWASSTCSLTVLVWQSASGSDVGVVGETRSTAAEVVVVVVEELDDVETSEGDGGVADGAIPVVLQDAASRATPMATKALALDAPRSTTVALTTRSAR